MSKKDYILIADALMLGFRYTPRPEITGLEALHLAQEAVIHKLQEKCPKFDSVRFREYIASHFVI